MNTKIIIWSQIGHTPKTNRNGSFCDELVNKEFNCDNPDEARKLTLELMKTTQYAARGYFNMPHWWNQNTKSAWL